MLRSQLLLLLLLLPMATRAAGFNCSLSSCGNSANCTPSTGICTCPTDKILGLEGDKCEQVTLLATSNKLTATNSTFVLSEKIDLTAKANFNGGIPLSSSEVATQIFLCSNGYVTFNTDFCTARVDLLKSASTPAFVAPFATSFDLRNPVSTVNSASEVSHKLVDLVSSDPALQKLKAGLPELANATSAIVFTWKLMSPPPLEKTQQISFQLILFTDFETVTAAVSLYSSTNTLKDYFDWLSTLIGSRAVTNGAASLIADTRSTSVAAFLKPMPFGTGLTATARLTVLYTGTAPNYRKRCFNEAALTLQPAMSSTMLGWCPRWFKQAVRDPRFFRPDTSQQAVFSVLSSKSANSTQITCSYDVATGGLLATGSYSNITLQSSSEPKVGAKLYEYCCDRVPNLCGKYYTNLPTPTSVNYRTPSAAGFAMGSGELRSFDGQLSRFLSVGDFWLVKTASPSKLSVQARLENTNPNANRTVGITGVVVQFMGTTNLSTEFHWVQATQQIMVNYVSYKGSASGYRVERNNTPDAVGQQITSDAVFTGTKTSLTLYVVGSSTWVTAQSGANGLSVSVYLDKNDYFNGTTSGLLGNYDGSAANDIVFRNGTNSTVSMAMESWKLASEESLFQFPATEPTAQAGWAALYWSADWNQTQMVQAVFSGNSSTYAEANLTCAVSLSTISAAYQNCLMEFADCGAVCAIAYRDLLAATTQAIDDFVGCGSLMLQWDATKTEISATEGTAYRVSLATLMSGTPPSGAVFAKVSGPADLTVNQNGSLEWASPSGVNATPIVVSVSATSGCASLVQLGVRLTRIAGVSGVCPNSAEDFGYLTSPAGESYRRDKIYLSTCKCNANYYTANCSMATCQLDCHTCNNTVPTECAACPSNYAASEVTVTKLAVCSYQDRCTASSCLGSAYKSCRSVDPALQTASLLYQCVCNTGYDYPNSTSKTICSDLNECNLLGYCDTSKNRRCVNTEGSFTCNCSPGYILNSGQCADINECTNAAICQNGACVNTPGSYYCNCSAGYDAVDASAQNCADVDECLNPGLSGCSQNCINSPGSFSCSCFAGFGSMPSCPATVNCTTPSSCSYPNLCSKISSTDTCHCPPPQTLGADKKTCNAVTYCTSNPCGTGGTCVELNPGYNCTCKQYYELNAAKKCTPIDYCNRRAQYPAVCPTGNNVECSVNATTNEPTCGCKTGFTRSSTSNTCVDVDECKAGTSGCNLASTDCKNLIGSWLCKCKFGYKRENSTQCTPAAYSIQVQATFTDLVYQVAFANPDSEEFLLMADIIEKRLQLGLPSDGSGQPTFRVSSLTNGSVVTGGVVSYVNPQTPATVSSGAATAGLNVVATSLNECLSNSTNDCLPAVHDCIDTTNGYTCQCKSGYTQTGTNSGYAGTSKIIQVCTDIDECLTQCRNDSNKVCVNLPGSFTCSCTKGTYSTNPISLPCEDPCVAGRCKNSGQCQYQANDQFPYRCVCLAGYTGFHCELLDDYYWGMQRNAIIIGVVLGALLLICLAVVLVFCLRKYRGDKNRADFYQSNFSDNPVTQSGGTYKGTQSMAMSDTSIPRAQHSAHHPSTYENQGYERETHKTRTDYF